jgi:hypothetical protein
VDGVVRPVTPTSALVADVEDTAYHRKTSDADEYILLADTYMPLRII